METMNRRQALASLGGGVSYLLLRPSLSLAHPADNEGLTVFAAAQGQDPDRLRLLAYSEALGVHVREHNLTERGVLSHGEKVGAPIESFFPVGFRTVDGVERGLVGAQTARSVIQNEDLPTPAEDLDIPEPPFPLPERDYDELQIPGVDVDQSFRAVGKFGFVAASASSSGSSIDVVLRPEFSDGDHLGVAEIVLDGSESTVVRMPPPLGSAAVTGSAETGFIVAVDHEEGTSYWQVSADGGAVIKLPSLEDTLPGTTTASAEGQTLTWVSKGRGRAIPYGLSDRGWKPAMSAATNRPHELIALAGSARWITLDQTKTELTVVSTEDEE